MSNKPVEKFRIGYVEAAVWKNKEGFHTVVLSRTYKDGDEYRSTDNLGHADIANAIRVLGRAEDWLAKNG